MCVCNFRNQFGSDARTITTLWERDVERGMIMQVSLSLLLVTEIILPQIRASLVIRIDKQWHVNARKAGLYFTFWRETDQQISWFWKVIYEKFQSMSNKFKFKQKCTETKINFANKPAETAVLKETRNLLKDDSRQTQTKLSIYKVIKTMHGRKQCMEENASCVQVYARYALIINARIHLCFTCV